MSNNSPETRALLALSFEPSDMGFIYYHWRWSRGVPVTAAEREAYLRLPVLYPRRAWRAAIAGRTTVPRRAFAPVYWKLLASMPTGMIFGALLAGVPLALSGLVELQTIGDIVRSMLGLVLVAIGMQVVWARHVGRGIGAEH